MYADESNEEFILLRDEIKRLRRSLSELTPSLEALLKRRGFRIYRREPSDDLLLPKEVFIDSYFEMMKKYNVSYVYVGPDEERSYKISERIEQMELVMNSSVKIYAISKRA